MRREKTYRQERDVPDTRNTGRIYSQMPNETTIKGVTLRLKMKYIQRNTGKCLLVYFVYFGYKTFKSVQALRILTCSKIKDESQIQFCPVHYFRLPGQLFRCARVSYQARDQFRAYLFW